MTSDSFPSRELLEVIKSQSRMEGKLEDILGLLKSTQGDIKELDGRVRKLENKSVWREAYVAGAGSIGGAGLAFFLPYIKSKLGL